MTFYEIYRINYAWELSTQLTITTGKEEKMLASEAIRRYGDYIVVYIDGDEVCISDPEEE
jgi:hypothetical protein|nr:MAG TPA: hypothetical protein [Caudoviricetes sp.]